MKIANCGFLKTMCHCTCYVNLSRMLGVNPCLLQEFRALTISPISAQGEEKHVLEMCFLISFTRERSIPAPHARRMFCTGFSYLPCHCDKLIMHLFFCEILTFCMLVNHMQGYC